METDACKFNFYLALSRGPNFFIATLCFPQELETNELKLDSTVSRKLLEEMLISISEPKP